MAVNNDAAPIIRERLLKSSSMPPSSQKLREKAVRLKELGNAHFKKTTKDELHEALKCYTKVRH